jgi:hypothetical protein
MYQHLRIPAKLAPAEIRAKIDEKLQTIGSAQLQGFNEDALAAAAKLLAYYDRLDVFILLLHFSQLTPYLYVFAV